MLLEREDNATGAVVRPTRGRYMVIGPRRAEREADVESSWWGEARCAQHRIGESGEHREHR